MLISLIANHDVHVYLTAIDDSLSARCVDGQLCSAIYKFWCYSASAPAPAPDQVKQEA